MMYTYRYLLLALFPLIGASATPYVDSAAQKPLTSLEDRVLVSSEAIQDDISSQKLLDRAKELFEIAKQSIDEYNHPTRVIGSKGSLKS